MEKTKLHQINHKKYNYFSDEDHKNQITDNPTIVKMYEDGEKVFIQKK